jgi:hypothetical protein
MQQDTTNNNPADNWKQRLETDEDCIAVFAGNDKAWDKLYARLHKPRRKKAVWYWMAAAGVAVILVCSIWMQPLLQQEADTAVQPTAASIKFTDEINKKQPKSIATASNKKTAAPVTSRKNKTTEENMSAHLDTIQVTVTEQKMIDMMPDTTALPVLLQEHTTAPLATVQPKPALKVVHVNELGEAEQNRLHRPGTDYSAIRIGVNNKTTQPTGKIGIHISTAKSSPSN